MENKNVFMVQNKPYDTFRKIPFPSALPVWQFRLDIIQSRESEENKSFTLMPLCYYI